MGDIDFKLSVAWGRVIRAFLQTCLLLTASDNTISTLRLRHTNEGIRLSRTDNKRS